MTPRPAPSTAAAVGTGARTAQSGQDGRARAAMAAERAVSTAGRIRVRHTRGCPSTADPFLETADAADLVGMIGPEATRYALIRQARNPAAPIDVGRWVRQTDENPVFLVQFAHARLAAVSRYAAALSGLPPARVPGPRPTGPGDGVPAAPTDAAPDRAELATATLRRTIGEYPRVLAHAGERLQPHRLTRYLERLAAAVRDYLCAVRVLAGALPDRADGAADRSTADRTAADDRLQLAAQARLILADGLDVLGVSAPERM